MSNNQHFHDVVIHTSLDVFLFNFTQFLPHNVDLSAHMKNLNDTTRSILFNVSVNKNESAFPS